MSKWKEEWPGKNGWYWVKLKKPFDKGRYMTLVEKGKFVYLFKKDGSIPSGGRVEDVKRAKGIWKKVKK